MAVSPAASLAAVSPPAVLLDDLLAVSLTGVILYTPLYDEAGMLTDFAFDYLNPAAQRMMGMPERPTLTHKQQWPQSEAHGTFAFHVEAFESGEPREYSVNYQADGYDNYYRLAARRSGQGLLVSFTDTADQPRSPVEVALRESQAREQTRRAEAETRRAELESIFAQAPVGLVLFQGPEYRIDLANTMMGEIWGRPVPQVLGEPVLEAMPEFKEQGFTELLADVYHQGTPYNLRELPVTIARTHTGLPAQGFFNVIYQPHRDRDGDIVGIVCLVVEVTDQVLARQQVQALNDELRARNEEYQQANAALRQAQYQVEQLNQELEARVESRTQEALALQAEVLAAARQQADERAALYQVFEQTAAVVALLRAPGHRFEYVNPAYQQLFPGRALVGRFIAEAVPELVDQGFTALMDRVYQTGETHFGQEVAFTSQPGPGQAPRTGYYNFTYQAYREAGAVAGISVFAYDVTEQVLARQERETQRQRFLTLFTNAPAAICILAGPDLVFEFANPGYHRLLPERTLLGRSFFEVLPELVGSPVEALLRHAYASGTTHEEQAMLVPIARAADGVLEERYFTFVYQARRDDHGQVDGLLVFAFEVTEQVVARQAAEASARQLRLITDALPVLIGYLDHERRYQFANEAYRAWFHQDPAALLDRPVREVVGEAAYANTCAYMDRALAGERVEFEATMDYRDGFTRHIRTTYVPDERAGQVRGFYTLVTDVTEQVEARRQVEALNENLSGANTQLTRTNVDLDNFIYTASHDLKAPITNIEGLLGTLRHELPVQPPEGEVGYILDLMQESVERFKRTIDHLTEVSKLQKEHDPPTAQVALAPVLEDVRQDLAPLLQQTGGRLHLHVAACPALRFAEKNLRSVLYNLLSNALKYHHPDRAPQVHVRCRPEAEYTVLEVQDNGLGLDLAHEKQLFAMFQRLHTHVEGSGLGLFMVKRIMENAGGKITVHSQLGEGTTFTVYFPR